MKSVLRPLVLCAVFPGAALAAQVVGPQLSISDVVVTEGRDRSVSAAFQVTLVGSTSEPVTVDWATADLTATAGRDYARRSGRLTFQPGGSQQAAIVVPVYRDGNPEPAEVFFVQLSNAVNAGIAKGTGHGAIVDGTYASRASKCDLDGLGRSDLIVGLLPGAPYDTHTDKHEPWDMTGTIARPLATVPSTWDIVATNDFNGDGICDLAWRDGGDRLAVTITPPDRTLRGPTDDDVVATVGQNWTVVGSGRFGPDAYADLLWWNREATSLEVWESAWESGRMEFPMGLRRVFPANVDSAWRAAAVADLNADGNPDLLWQHATSFQVKYWRRAWQEANEVVLEGFLNPAAPESPWNLVAGGDFDGNGAEDLLFREAGTLKLAVWFMQGTSRVASSFLSPARLGPTEVDGTPCVVHSESWEIRGPR